MKFAKYMYAITAFALLSGSFTHAQDRRSASAQLHLQVVVMPTLVAAQQASVQVKQPSPSPISFSFQQSDKTAETYSMQEVIGLSTKSPAVLQTRTIVPE